MDQRCQDQTAIARIHRGLSRLPFEVLIILSAVLVTCHAAVAFSGWLAGWDPPYRGLGEVLRRTALLPVRLSPVVVAAAPFAWVVLLLALHRRPRAAAATLMVLGAGLPLLVGWACCSAVYAASSLAVEFAWGATPEWISWRVFGVLGHSLVPFGLWAAQLAAIIWAPRSAAPVAEVRCAGCGYDLAGLRRGAACPECGAAEPTTPPPSAPAGSGPGGG